MAVDLVFGRSPYAGGPVDLVFGAGLTPPAPDPLTAHADVVLGGISVAAVAIYDNRNPRRATTAAQARHQVAARSLPDASVGWGQTARELGQHATGWQPASPVAGERDAVWVPSARLLQHQSAKWQQGAPVQTERSVLHQRAASLRAQAQAPWQLGALAGTSSALVHQAALSLLAQALGQWQQAQARHALATGRHGSGVARVAGLLMPWQTGRAVPPGREVWPPVDPSVRPPREINTHLVFACPPWLGGSVHLVFGRVCGAPPGPQAGFVILPARFYMAVHSLVAHRLPDLTEIPIYDLSLSADAGSFGWSFNASAPVSAFDALAPSSGLPAQVRFTLDGLPFAFVVDSLQKSEEFGRRSVRFAGRSITALLARPYARETSRGNAGAAATAQQLTEQALDTTGVTLDWGLTDWLVPAGAWSHSGTPLAAVQAIVEAAGGYLQSHRSAAQLLARHPYPELAGGLPGGPWNWYAPGVVPDVDLAPDAIITSAIERRDGPAINGVYVSGTTQGVLALVKRTGSAADQLASLVTDPLITAQEVALQRGLSVLGAAGPKHLVTLDLPVLTGSGQPGVLDVGQLVQVNTATPWRGRVRSVGVNARMPSVRQSVQIERHLEVA